MGGLSTYMPPVTTSRYSTNYQGSYDEYVFRAARSLAERYAAGEPVYENFTGNTGSIGQPSRLDFGSAGGGRTGQISQQTYDFFANYVAQYGGTDPYISGQFGAAPTNRATFGPDPNSESELAKMNNASAERRASIAAGAQVQSAQIGANAQIASVKMQTETQWNIAQLEAVTSRYIAEGNWGVQKYIAQLQETGAMDRLKLELAQNDKLLAQNAIAEGNRHHETMVGLALEVAKYDAELARQPRNWIAYATWLGQRDITINGLNLSMAADLVPPDQANDPAAVAASGVPGANTAALQAATQQGAPGTAPATGPRLDGGPVTEGQAGTPAAQQQAAQAGANGNVGNVDLSGTDYAAIARQLLGLDPNEATTVPTAEQMQAAYDSTNTAGRRVSGFGDQSGMRTNALGMNINTLGQKEDYRNFTDLLDSQQEMRLGAVESTGKWAADFGKEMQRSRPKGNVQGAVAFG